MRNISHLMKVAKEHLQERKRLKALEPAGWEADIVPSTGVAIYRIHMVPEGQQDGPFYDVVLDEKGAVVDPEALAQREKTILFPPFPRPRAAELNPPVETTLYPAPPPPAGTVTINPSTNDLYLEPGQTFAEDIHVIVPAVAIPNIDLYLLPDTTGSMVNTINALKAGATNMVNTLLSQYPTMAIGVGNYRDFRSNAALYCFQHQLNPTTGAAVLNAINAWTTVGGEGDIAGQLYALDQVATSPNIQWRPGARRIVVWIGDAPGHDPICAGLPGVPTAITEAIATGHLIASSSNVIAISMSTSGSGLNGIPHTLNYPCPNTGTAWQASRITASTHGSLTMNVNANLVCTAVLNAVNAAAGTFFGNVRLAASGDTAPHTTSITPSGGYGPVSAGQNHDYLFHLVFTGPPCANLDKVYTGTIDVIGDGQIVAQKEVKISVTACQRWSYAVKFVCGQVENDRQGGEPAVAALALQPGSYSTDVNILNYHEADVTVRRYFYELMRGAAANGRDPGTAGRSIEGVISLNEHSATFLDCQRLYELMGTAPGDDKPLLIGYLELVSPVELHITAVYTAKDHSATSVDIDVVQIEGKQILR